jgi:creatinine amidohydrolase
MLEWQYLTGPAIDALDRDTTVLYLSSSPLEVHGPHLPTCTDIAEADALFERMVPKLKARHPEMQFVRLPPLYVAADVLPHVGSIKFRQGTIRRVFDDLGRSLCSQGFKYIWIGGFHGGPRHFIPIEMAAEAVNRRYDACMISVFGLMLRELTGGRTDLADVLDHLDGLDRADLEGDAHGGVVETSMMLHILGQHVDPVYRELEPMTVDLEREKLGLEPLGLEDGGRPSLSKILESLFAKLKYYERNTYSGAPAKASPELGGDIYDVLAEHGANGLSKVWTGQIHPLQAHSPVWKLRWAFASEWLTDLVERALDYRSKVW